MQCSPKLPAFSGICRPGRFSADAHYSAARAVLLANQRRAQCSTRADALLALLLPLLVLAGLANCASTRTAQPKCPPTQVRGSRNEHPAPQHGCYEWRGADENE